MQTQKTRNYIGLFGALLVLLGFCVPFADSQNFLGFTGCVIAQDFSELFAGFCQYSTIIFTAYLYFVVLAGLAFSFSFHKTGFCLSLIPAVYFLLILLQEGPALFEVADLGFWLSAVGFLMMLLANSMTALNKKIHAAFQIQTTADSVPAPQNTRRSAISSYVGIGGAGAVLLGLFLPCATVWFDYPISIYDLFQSISPYLSVFYVALLVGIAVAYFFRQHLFGCFLALPYTVYYMVGIIEVPDILKVGQIGFWFTIIGSVLMVVSPIICMPSLNQQFPFSVLCGRKTTHKSNRPSAFRRTKTCMYEKRGYAGIVGAVFSLLGFFLPYATGLWVGSVSIYDLFTAFPIIVFAYVALLIGIAAAYFFRHHIIGCFLSLPYAIYYTIDILAAPEFLEIAQIGYWLTIIGAALMVLSPIVSKFLPVPAWDPYRAPDPQDSVVIPGTDLGYVGMAGALFTMVGLFVPYFTFMGRSASFFTFFNSELSPVLTIVYVALLLGVGVAYFLRRHILGCLLSIPFVMFLPYVIFSAPELLLLGQAGFWMTVGGILLMLLSPLFTKRS